MSKKQEKVLCVDDEHDILDILSYNLEKEGYTVHTADTGDKAIAEAEKVNPDLVLLDIMMPGMDGLEVCKAIRSNPLLKDVPVIFLTAKADEVDEIIGLEFGADDYISKPFSPSKIVARVKALFRRAELQNGKAAEKKCIFKLGGIEIDRDTNTATLNGKEVKFLHDPLNFFSNSSRS